LPLPEARSRKPENPLLLRPRDHRTHLDRFALGGIPHLQRFDRGYELLQEPVVDLGPRHDPRRGRAVLAGVPVAGDLDALRDRRRIGVVEDDDGGLAAELEVHALEGLRRGARDLLARRDVAGEGDHGDVRVTHDAGAHRLAVPRDHVQHAGREDVRRILGEHERRQRRLLRGLEDRHVAGGERRADLPDGHHQRVVPRGDLADDADRLASHHRRVAPHVLARRTALEKARGAREEAQVVRRHRDLVHDDRVRLADVGGLRLLQLLGMLLERVGELQERLGALLRRRLAPLLEPLLRSLDRPVDIGLAPAGHLRHDLARRGLSTSIVSPSAASTHSPPTKFW
jgi:ParB family chromosome partitioning protein